jgi:hypothetical protein
VSELKPGAAIFVPRPNEPAWQTFIGEIEKFLPRLVGYAGGSSRSDQSADRAWWGYWHRTPQPYLRAERRRVHRL